MNRNGIRGETADRAVCNASVSGNVIVAGDQVPGASQYFVDCNAGTNQANCGLPGNPPCRSLQYAWNTASSSGYKIICFSGTCAEGDFILANGGAAGSYSVAPSGNQVRAFSYPDKPKMIIGWDRDRDGNFPPFDTDDVAVADGTGFHKFIARNGKLPSYLEFAHFSARNYGADKGLSQAQERGFMGRLGSYSYFHDLELSRINDNSCQHSGSIAFDQFGASNHIALENISSVGNGGYFIRGTGGGPVRYQNISVSMRGMVEGQTCGSFGGRTAFIKLWHEITGLEVLDNLQTCDIDNWNGKPAWAPCTGVVVDGCSQDWDIVNNEFRDSTGGVDVQCSTGKDFTGVTYFCSSRPVNDVLVDRNLFVNTRGITPGLNRDGTTSIPNIFQGVSAMTVAAAQEDPTIDATNCKDIRFTNNMLYWNNPQWEKGFYYSPNPSRSSPIQGNIEIVNNTLYGPLQDTTGPVFTGSWHGYIVFDSGKAGHDNIILKNNIIGAGGSSGCRNIHKGTWTYGGNNINIGSHVYDSDCNWHWNGTDYGSFSNWAAASPDSSSGSSTSYVCAPSFVDPVLGNLRLATTDTCASNRGESLSTITTHDYDRQSRPLGLPWEIGADEQVTSSSPPAAPTNLQANF